MAYTDIHGAELSDDKKTLIKCPRNITGDYSIPWGVEIIGKRAFFLTKYTSVYIPSSVRIIDEKAFDGCQELESAEIPDGVTSIGKFAFNGCFKLKHVHIPASVSEIGEEAFTGCSGFSVDEENEVYDSRENCNAIIETSSDTLIQGCAETIIPYGTKHIGNKAFQWCFRLVQISIPDSVRSIGNSAFAKCKMLNHIEIPDSVTQIGTYAFSEIEDLTSISIPDSIKTIKAGMFAGCKNLQNIFLPNTITHIGNSAFRDCSSLTSISIPNSVVQIGYKDTSTSFSLVDGGAFSGCTNLRTIEIPHSVAVLGAYTFAYCTNLSSIVISNSAIEIENNAFCHCESLEKIEVPGESEKRFYYMECFKNFHKLFRNTYQRNKGIRNFILAIFFAIDVIALYYVGKGLYFQSAMLLTTMLYAPFSGISDMWFLEIVMFILGLIGLPFYGCFMAIIAGLPLEIGNMVANAITKDEIKFKDSHVFLFISLAIVIGFGAIVGFSIAEYDTKSLIIAIISIILAAITPIIGYGVASK